MKKPIIYKHVVKTKLVFLFVALLFPFLSLKAMRKAKIAVIGAAPAYQPMSAQIVENIRKFWTLKLDQVKSSKPDLILLPEACDRPSNMSVEEQFAYFRHRKDSLQHFFAAKAKEFNSYIAAGMKIQAINGQWYNTILLFDRSGNLVSTYIKNFPTIDELEAGIVPGRDPLLFQCDFGSVGFAICYDLNFDNLMNAYAKLKPDIILFSSVYHGGLAQEIWAYKCRSFLAASISDKRVPSEIRNPLGEVMAATTNYTDFTITTINMDRALVHLDFNEQKLAKLKAGYGDDISIHDPGRLGSVLISSEKSGLQIQKLLKDNGIEELDKYLLRSLERIRNK